ncbi:MAG TPA: alpha/beta hydrolase [Planctomycetaceae bacterium]|nr:alpha/beta hydrolase [Planctomycetaceae bacterium]
MSSLAQAAPPEPILLWPEGAPGAVGTEDQDKPTLRLYQPSDDKKTGTAIVVCPGGGYGGLAMDHEGVQVAQWLNEVGITALVLKYRLGRRYPHPTPTTDVQRAIRYTRANAEKLGVSPSRIGVMGFSAGGHLASTAATHFDAGKADSADPIDRVSSRPDFAILCSPVITMDKAFTHGGSRANLLGDNPDQALVDLMSNEKQVTEQTPPVFLFHTADDGPVPVENSIAFFSALRKHKVPAELHVYRTGNHGVGLAPGNPALSGWKDVLYNWMKNAGLLTDKKRAAVDGEIKLDGKPIGWGQVALVPQDPRAPATSAMISGGKFQMPAESGPTPGVHRVAVYYQGGFAPHPTIERVVAFDENRGLVFDVSPDGKNTLSLELSSR